MQVSAHEIPAPLLNAQPPIVNFETRPQRSLRWLSQLPKTTLRVNILVYMLGKSSGSNFIGHRQQFNLPKPAVSESSRLV